MGPSGLGLSGKGGPPTFSSLMHQCFAVGDSHCSSLLVRGIYFQQCQPPACLGVKLALERLVLEYGPAGLFLRVRGW